MCESMSKAYLDFLAKCSFFESTESPQELSQALGALTSFHDPYMDTAKGCTMADDYYRG